MAMLYTLQSALSVAFIKDKLRISNACRTKRCYHPAPPNTFCSPRLQGIYKNMCRRCSNPASKDYRWYGGRGIKVCEEWITHPEKFNEWAISSGYKPDLSIDRIDPNRGYQPDNCRWISLEDNSKYKRTSRLITINEHTNTLRGWAAEFNIPRTSLANYARGKTDEEVIAYILKRYGQAAEL